MADTPDPYVRKEPGDIMLAADWNEMQVRARSELRAHNHSDDAASRIPREGIADKAVDGSKIDPESKLTLKGLTLAGPLKVSGTSQLADIKAALANFSGARLTTTGDLGVGTDTPENAEGWSRVVDVLGAGHAKLSVRAGDVDARLMAHTEGIFGSEPGMIVGTRSAHPRNSPPVTKLSGWASCAHACPPPRPRTVRRPRWLTCFRPTTCCASAPPGPASSTPTPRPPRSATTPSSTSR